MQLIITEKPTSAKKVANSLNLFNVQKYKSITYFTSDDYIIFGVKGHIYQRNYSLQYSRWNSILPSELLTKQIYKELKDLVFKDFIKFLAKKYVITNLGLFTDFDLEGELIAKDVMDLVLANLKTITNIDRFTVSALTKPQILFAIENAKKLNLPLAKAAETRHILDLKLGIILTRSLSLSYMKIQKLRFIKNPLSIGRVQTPLLKIVGDRATLIKEFKAVPFYEYVLNTSQNIIFKVKSEVLLDQNISPNQDLVVTITQVKRTIQTPRPMNSADLMKLGGSLGLGSKQTMVLAEKLYLQGLITYPRTDNRFLLDSDAKVIFNNLSLSEVLNEEITLKPKSEYIYNINQGNKDLAHPSILPTQEIKIPIDEKEKILYLGIIKYFLNVIEKPTIYLLEKGSISLCNVVFETKTHKLIQPGFTNYKPIYNQIPQLVNFKDLNYTQKYTLPPKTYTNSEIIMLMQRNKLGTKSTRHTFLPLLKERFYVTSINTLTKLGALVYDLVKCSAISSLEFTKEIETDLKDIETDLRTSESVIAKYNPKILTMITELDCNEL